MELLSTLADGAAASGKVDRAGFVAGALRELSVALCKGNGLMFRDCVNGLARASGHTFRNGAAVPSADVS